MVTVIGRMDEAVNRITQQDAELRTRMEQVIARADQSVQANNQAIDTRFGTVDTAMGNADGRIGVIESLIQGINTADIDQLKNIVSALASQDVGTHLGNMNARIGVMEQGMSGIQAQLTAHGQKVGSMETDQQQIIGEVRKINEGGRGPERDRGPGKLVMDHRCWEEVRKLTNERSGFRDWKVRFKDAMKQISKCKAWKSLMEFVEDPKRSTGETEQTLEEKWEEYNMLEGIDTGTVTADWDNLSQELETILLAKSEDKSEAFLLTKRAGNGILAWSWINDYYTATSGMGISKRMGMVMMPKGSKKDEDVMYDVEAWLDELRELIAMGEPDLPPGYKISAIKSIATDKIKEQIDIQEQKMAGKDPEMKYKVLRDLALNM